MILLNNAIASIQVGVECATPHGIILHEKTDRPGCHAQTR